MNQSNPPGQGVLPGINDATLRHILEQFLATSFNAMVITTAEPGYPIVYANPAFCRMTGYSLQELQGRSPRIFQGAMSSPRILQRLARDLAAGRPFYGATTNYRKSGESYPVEWNISPIRDDSGRITHFISVQKDLSHLRRVMTRLKSTNENFREFLHDIAVQAERIAADELTQHVAQEKQKLTEALLDNARLYNPALRSQEHIELFDESEFFDLSDDSNGVLGDPIEREHISAVEYLARESLGDGDIVTLQDVIEEVLQQLDLLQHGSGKARELSIIADNLQEVANTVFYLEDFVGISSVLAELATRTRLKASVDMPSFMIDTYRALMQDLQRWIDRIFISSVAADIHEMDASIISSARQLLMFLR